MKRPVVITLLIVALVLVCAGIGSVLFFTVNGGFPNNIIDAPLISTQSEESKTLNVDRPVSLTIVNESGRVAITGADVDEITVDVVKTGLGTTQANATEALENIRYEIEQNGDTVRLTFEYPKIQTQIYQRVDFIVTVPVETRVDVDAGSGEVSVSGTSGNVDVVNDFGTVKVDNIEGGLTVDTQSGQVEAVSINAGDEDILLSSGFGKVTLEKATAADISLTSNSGALELNNVRASGRVEVSTDFGDASFTSGSADELTVETNSGKVTLRQLNVNDALTVKDDFGSIELEQVNADSYDVHTNSGSVTIDGASGNVRAHSDFGSVTLQNAENVTVDLSTNSGSVDFEGSLGEGPHTIQSEFGEILVTIPADSALDVDLKTDFGSIRSDIPITVTLTGETDRNRQTGTMNEGGSQLTVETNSGGISIQASK